jgi:two-component system response regulator (stage 0 sporulation protein F)
MARILVADDETVIRQALGEVLRAAGHKVVEAKDGRVDHRVLQGVDAAIVDIFMPERDGLELILDIRGCFPRIKIVAITGLYHSEGVDVLGAARQLGAHATLEKPFKGEQLLGTLRAVLAQA